MHGPDYLEILGRSSVRRVGFAARPSRSAETRWRPI